MADDHFGDFIYHGNFISFMGKLVDRYLFSLTLSDIYVNALGGDVLVSQAERSRLSSASWIDCDQTDPIIWKDYMDRYEENFQHDERFMVQFAYGLNLLRFQLERPQLGELVKPSSILDAMKNIDLKGAIPFFKSFLEIDADENRQAAIASIVLLHYVAEGLVGTMDNPIAELPFDKDVIFSLFFDTLKFMPKEVNVPDVGILEGISQLVKLNNFREVQAEYMRLRLKEKLFCQLITAVISQGQSEIEGNLMEMRDKYPDLFNEILKTLEILMAIPKSHPMFGHLVIIHILKPLLIRIGSLFATDS